MAKFVGLKWMAQSGVWDIVFRGRKPHVVADNLVNYADNGGVEEGGCIGLARVPSGMDPLLFVGSLPPPDFSSCRLCRERKVHTKHYTVH